MLTPPLLWLPQGQWNGSHIYGNNQCVPFDICGMAHISNVCPPLPLSVWAEGELVQRQAHPSLTQKGSSLTSSERNPPSCACCILGQTSNHSGDSPSIFDSFSISATRTAPEYLASITSWCTQHWIEDTSRVSSLDMHGLTTPTDGTIAWHLKKTMHRGKNRAKQNII